MLFLHIVSVCHVYKCYVHKCCMWRDYGWTMEISSKLKSGSFTFQSIILFKMFINVHCPGSNKRLHFFFFTVLVQEPGSVVLPYKSLNWKTIGDRIQITSPGAGARPMRVMLGANRASLQWNVSQPRWRSESLARTSVWSSGWIWRESGTTSKAKSKSVSVLHGCQGLEGCPFSKTVEWRLFPFLNAKAAGSGLCRPCFLTWYRLKEWVSSSVHHNAPGSKGQGARLLWC